MRVFVIEDSPAIRDRLIGLLDSVSGVELVGQAADVSGALEGIASTDPEALILDIRLADGNGLDLLRRVKPGRPGLRTIVLTNFANDQYRRVAMSAGAEHFLDKSSEFGRVREILQGWIAAPGVACQGWIPAS